MELKYFFDDLIIAAKDITDHDRILEQVLRRARKNNVKFNINKFQFRVSEVNYVGNVVSAGGLKPDPEKVRAITKYHPFHWDHTLCRALVLL